MVIYGAEQNHRTEHSIPYFIPFREMPKEKNLQNGTKHLLYTNRMGLLYGTANEIAFRSVP